MSKNNVFSGCYGASATGVIYAGSRDMKRRQRTNTRLLLLTVALPLGVVNAGTASAQVLSLNGALTALPSTLNPSSTELRLILGHNESQIGQSSLGLSGQFTLVLPQLTAEQLPRTLISALRLDRDCAFTPVISPSNTRASTALIRIHDKTNGAVIGLVDMTRRQSNGALDSDTFLLFVDKDTQLSGEGNCGKKNSKTRLKATFKHGWNLVSLSKATDTENTIDLTVKSVNADQFRFTPDNAPPRSHPTSNNK